MCKILAVDDNFTALTYYKKAMSNLKHEVIVAHHGKMALELLNEKNINYDIILLDMEMPIMNGIETVKEIRKINKTIPIIMVSAYSSNDLIKEALTVGATDYYIKPLTMNRLENVINTYTLA